MSFDISVVTQNANLLWQGFLVTLYYTVVTMAAGMLIGPLSA